MLRSVMLSIKLRRGGGGRSQGEGPQGIGLAGGEIEGGGKQGGLEAPLSDPEGVASRGRGLQLM